MTIFFVLTFPVQVFDAFEFTWLFRAFNNTATVALGARYLSDFYKFSMKRWDKPSIGRKFLENIYLLECVGIVVLSNKCKIKKSVPTPIFGVMGSQSSDIPAK